MKKFLAIALVMIIGSTIFLISSKSYMDRRYKTFVSGYEDVITRIEASFIRFEEDNSSYKFYVNIKNNCDKIITFESMKMVFAKGNQNEVLNSEFDIGRCLELPIMGRENIDYDVPNYEYGIDPGDSREYIFTIPKEVSFDETVNFNKMKLDIYVKEYSHRIKNALYGGRTTWTAPIYIKNTGDPIVIDNN